MGAVVSSSLTHKVLHPRLLHPAKVAMQRELANIPGSSLKYSPGEEPHAWWDNLNIYNSNFL